MAIHLVTLVGAEGWRTLEPMLEHYRGLGVEAFHVTLHLDSPVDPAREPVLDIVERFGCGLYETVEGQFALVQREAYAKPRRDYPRDWFILADTDEFQRYPRDLRSITAECEQNDWEYVRGALVDRVADDGGFPELDPALTLDAQFPLGCIVTPVIQRSQPRKVTLVRGAIRVEYGQHEALYGIGCPRDVAFVPVHHFKWNSTAVESLRLRSAAFKEQGVVHWEKSRALVDHVEENGGRLDLELPGLLVGRCDPEYPHWEEYRNLLFAAETETGG